MSNHEKLSVGSAIAERREELGLSQRELAEKAGVNRNTVQFIEVGKSMGSRRSLEKIAAALKTTVPQLYARAGQVRTIAEQAYGRDPLVTRFEILLEQIPLSQRLRFIEALEDLVKSLIVDL